MVVEGLDYFVCFSNAIYCVHKARPDYIREKVKSRFIVKKKMPWSKSTNCPWFKALQQIKVEQDSNLKKKVPRVSIRLPINFLTIP
jgi:hypothetical protein